MSICHKPDCFGFLPTAWYAHDAHPLRSRAAKMELWREDVGEAMSELMNELTLLGSPSFIYAAHPSATTLKVTDIEQ